VLGLGFAGLVSVVSTSTGSQSRRGEWEDETGTETWPNYKRHPAAVAHGPNLSKSLLVN
jgi:hypothetical protein